MSNLTVLRINGTDYDLGKPTDSTLTQDTYPADASETGRRFEGITEPTHNLFPEKEISNDGTSTSIDKNIVTVTATRNSSCSNKFMIDVREISSVVVSFKQYTGTGSGGIRLAKLSSDGTFVSWIDWLTPLSDVENTTGGYFVKNVSEVDYLGIFLYAIRAENAESGKYITYDSVMVVSGSKSKEYMLPVTSIDAVARKLIEEISYEPSITTVVPVDKNLADTSLWEAGTISSSTGQNANQGDSVRLKEYIEVNNSVHLYIQAYYSLPTDRVDVSATANYNLRNAYILQYEKSGEYISRITLSSSDAILGSSITLNDKCKYIRIAFYTRLSNSDISVIMPATIYIDAVVGEYWLPPYYDGYLEEKASVIEQYAREAAGNGNVFVFITDQHAPQYNEMRSPTIIHRLAELAHLPLLFSGGDVDQNGKQTKVYCDALRDNYSGEIHHIVGNHDFLNQNTGTSLYYDMDMYKSNQVGSGEHHYYYVDDAQRKTRYIILAAYMESESAMGTGTGTAAQGGYTAEQITWINDVALDVPSDWDILVFTHYFYLINTSTKVATLSYGTSILESLSANPNVIACFQGHAHFDRIIKGHDGVAGDMPIIITTCDKNIQYQGNEGWTVNRSKGTIYEQCFDVVIINKNTRTIKMVRIGGLAENGINDDAGTTAEERTIVY